MLAIAGLAVVARLPFLTRPFGVDEGGLTVVAAQWSPGRSVYGNYFVDRPPLLLDFFALAHALGGVVALRVLGLVLVAGAVVLAARLAALGGGSPRLGAATAAIFLVHPLFGALEVNGELVSVPVVLAGMVSALEAGRCTGARSRAAWLLATGAFGTAALLVKQNELDVLVFAGAGAGWLGFLRRGRGTVRRPFLWVAAGGAGLVGAVLVHAALRGTGPAALADAIVTFRFEAATVIRSSATAATTDRLLRMLLALVVSGVPLIVLQLLRRLRDRPRAGAPDLRLPTVAVLAWETVSVLGGGSYWLHYLVNLVPGLVLAVTVVTAADTRGSHRSRRPRWADRIPSTAAVLAWALASCLVALAGSATRPAPAQDAVVGWLRQHVRPGDTAVVAFGHADYLAETGLTSPYAELWSLPVRVRDPRLTELTAVLSGASRPDWVVTGATGSLRGWGIDARSCPAGPRAALPAGRPARPPRRLPRPRRPALVPDRRSSGDRVTGIRPVTSRRPGRDSARPTGTTVTTGVPGAPRILVVSASIGAGHDGVATELARRAREAGYAADVVDFLGFLPPGVGAVLRSACR